MNDLVISVFLKEAAILAPCRSLKITIIVVIGKIIKEVSFEQHITERRTHHSNGFQWYFRTTRCYSSEPVYSSLQTELPIIVSTAYGIHLMERWFSHKFTLWYDNSNIVHILFNFCFFQGGYLYTYIIVFWSMFFIYVGILYLLPASSSEDELFTVLSLIFVKVIHPRDCKWQSVLFKSVQNKIVQKWRLSF